MKKRIYVAGSFANRHRVNAVYMRALLDDGHRITLNWTKLKKRNVLVSDKSYYRNIALRDTRAVLKADVLVVIWENPRDHLMRGTSTELGMALALNRPVLCYNPFGDDLPLEAQTFLQHPGVRNFRRFSELRGALASMRL